MSFILIIVRTILAIEIYNLLVDYIITKKVLKDIGREYDYLFKTRYVITNSLTFNIIIDTISLYSKLRYYDEFKDILIDSFLEEGLITFKKDNELTIDFEKSKIVTKEKEDNNILNTSEIDNKKDNIIGKNKPKMRVLKKEDRQNKM